MNLHIGILAHSAEGATLCYRTVWMEGVRRLGSHMHPEITLTGTAMAPTLELWEAGDLAALRGHFEDADFVEFHRAVLAHLALNADGWLAEAVPPFTSANQRPVPASNSAGQKYSVAPEVYLLW